MALTIWVDDWQMQCCGDPFAPGDVVSWALMEVDPEDYVHLVGEERAEGIDFCEEHHGGEEGVPQVPLEVVSVVEVHCRYGLLPGATDRIRGPVPGTTELVPVEGAADGWAKAREGATFAGYLVTARRQ
ncbi:MULTISPECIES: DUF6578 domain-containing protein [unclassified Streptomyces]|uniref:DUF6578 domain-containing protein n=1 Tax=unclassified Streptomyces TaxID=2593676 RepID=UPI002ED0C7CC|nr:hypothetical protein OH827_09620 [Streptomyces sp. NBC_00891]WSY05267.1 hypothetical protein OG464_09620 [Streptomyces sp. NBC_00890]WSZ06891.1 hypothetical protein OG704_09620 [Streptomyces sp. NBC_00869]WSZ25611.1 hypothetical protein OG498_23945 [Streptomyces sp. NBC_00870]